MKVTLPYPISANKYWRYSPLTKRVHVSPGAKTFKSEVRLLCRKAGFKPVDGDVELNIGLVPKGKRHMDLDNALKVTIDALQGCGYWNDKQVKRICAEILPADKDNPRLEVQIEEIKTD